MQNVEKDIGVLRAAGEQLRKLRERGEMVHKAVMTITADTRFIGEEYMEHVEGLSGFNTFCILGNNQDDCDLTVAYNGKEVSYTLGSFGISTFSYS